MSIVSQVGRKHCLCSNVSWSTFQIFVGGRGHVIDQGEGGKQGDALMSLLFPWPPALEAVQRHLRMKSCSRVWTEVHCTRPQACDALERVARTVNPRAVVWRDPSCLPMNRGSRSFALQWGTQLSLPPTLRELLLSIKSCRIASPMSQMSSPRGCSCSTVHQLEQTTCCGCEP